MPTPAFDLQSHSTHSDGALPPEAVVSHAAAAGVELLALSDHDTVDGVAEAGRAGREAGIGVVTATEVSALYDGYEDLHVLGYGVDIEAPGLLSALASFRDDRELRAERMLERLGGFGYAIDRGAIDERLRAGKTVGRPHIAGAVISAPENAERLASERLGDVTPFIRAYLIAGKPAFVGRTRPTVPEAIDLIHEASGVAVWAHPFWDIDDPETVERCLREFAAAGLDGVEAFYPTHTADQTQMLATGETGRHLLTTGSSDFHGPAHKLFRGFRTFELHGVEPRLGPILDAAS